MSAGYSRTKYWLSGAIFAAAVSFAHANPTAGLHHTAPYSANASYQVYDATRVSTPRSTAFASPYPDRVATRPATHYAGVQYAGAITPISTETRGAPHPPSNTQTMHTGSIRDDVARYNEERVSRQIARPPADGGRPQGPSPYRN
nr:hypothetical protein [Paraburkholderia humisilvae]